MDGVCVAHIKMGHSSARQIHCEHTDTEWSSVDKAIVCLQRSLSLSPIHAVTPQPFLHCYRLHNEPRQTFTITMSFCLCLRLIILPFYGFLFEHHETKRKTTKNRS